MKRSIFVMSLALVALPLTACVEDGYGYGGVYMGSVYPYSGYYDGFYGPIYDGYWGSNGYFYYRLGEQDRAYKRGDRSHFYRGRDVPNTRFHPIEGSTRPQQGARMPHFGGAGGHDRHQGRDRDRDRDHGKP
ncbi:hypothetical protein SAMN05444678_1342 [Sphingomonas sp. YR710]|uniref:hypothetical protein n=1 Tax=Sphingomonas sp. YR710 TaxID=1882773 RepID=UPI000889F50C|nr:hypothetical protein [Sphingomonas sp. YR710]SDD89775.1 hypothetical protein SAMN05444678_1342 [Sphingomonas sp. YR710]